MPQLRWGGDGVTGILLASSVASLKPFPSSSPWLTEKPRPLLSSKRDKGNKRKNRFCRRRPTRPAATFFLLLLYPYSYRVFFTMSIAQRQKNLSVTTTCISFWFPAIMMMANVYPASVSLFFRPHTHPYRHCIILSAVYRDTTGSVGVQDDIDTFRTAL